MILIILLLSALFVIVGLVINESNAKYLLAGYNTATEAQRKQLKIGPYIRFFRRFHMTLGLSLLGLSLLVYYLIGGERTGLFIAAYPIAAYTIFIWRSSAYVEKPTKSQKLTTWILILLFILLLILIIGGFAYTIGDNSIVVSKALFMLEEVMETRCILAA